MLFSFSKSLPLPTRFWYAFRNPVERKLGVVTNPIPNIGSAPSRSSDAWMNDLACRNRMKEGLNVPSPIIFQLSVSPFQSFFSFFFKWRRPPKDLWSTDSLGFQLSSYLSHSGSPKATYPHDMEGSPVLQDSIQGAWRTSLDRGVWWGRAVTIWNCSGCIYINAYL